MTCQIKRKVQQAKHKGHLAKRPETTHRKKPSNVSQPPIFRLTTLFSCWKLPYRPPCRAEEATNTRVCGIAIIFVVFGVSGTHTIT